MLKKLLSTPTTQLGRASRFLVFQIKLWSHCARLLVKNRAGQQAAALSYHTIFGIAPLAIVTLLIFQLFPAYKSLGDNVKNLVYEQLHLSTIEYPDPANPDETIMFTQYLDNIIGDIFTGLNEGTIAIFSAIIIIWAALALLSTIERSFNRIWHVSQDRSFLQRIINYWALLTLGPLLLGVGIYITTRYAAIGQLQKTVLAHLGPALLSYIVATIAFFLLYFVLPNARVQAKAAIWGAATAALVWTFAKLGFGAYVTKFIPYSQLYGVLGLIPLGVLWIYITWLVVLFGLQLTFTTQYLKRLDADQIAAAGKTEEYFIANDLTAINIVRQIATAFETDNAPVPSELISTKLNIPAEFTEKILSHLVEAGLIARTSEPASGFLPARDPANIRLSDIAAVVAQAGFAQSTARPADNLQQITQSGRDILARYSLKQILTTDQDSRA